MKPTILVLLLTACAAPASYGTFSLPESNYLPETARDLLAERMLNHGNDMSDLLWATLFLDEDSVRDIAEHIKATPRFARPIEKDATELNSSLPQEFFQLQDELIARATDLAEIASSHDANGMAAAYGALTQTCVRCHSLYLGEPPVTMK